MKPTRTWMTVLTVGIVLACSTALEAQKDNSRFGIRAGFQTAQLRSDIGDLFNSNQNRYFVGIYKESWMVPVLRLQMGLEYYETGSRQDEIDLKLGYLTIPAALKVDIGLFNVYGGISGGYRLFAHESVNGERQEIDGSKYKRFDYSTFVGGGITLLFVGIDIRHHWGQTNVHDGFKNRFWQLGATVKF